MEGGDGTDGTDYDEDDDEDNNDDHDDHDDDDDDYGNDDDYKDGNGLGSDDDDDDPMSKLAGLEEEINLMKQLDHPHIVRYLGTHFEGGRHAKLFILMEYMPGGSIAALLRQFGGFSEDVVREYSRQILLGLQYLHTKNIIHRDIKGGNILVDGSGLVKLADFGCSIMFNGNTSMDSQSAQLLGSVPWMAPEAMRNSHMGRKADVWSVGCTIVEVCL